MTKKILLFMAIITLLNTAIYGQCQTEQSAIAFPDPNLEAVIRDAIDKPEGDIYASDLDGIELLNADRSKIKDITGIEHCRNLENLSLWGNEITDVSPLSGLTNLYWLYLNNNQITNVSSLSGLNKLTRLKLGCNQITDGSPLSGLMNRILAIFCG